MQVHVGTDGAHVGAGVAHHAPATKHTHEVAAIPHAPLVLQLVPFPFDLVQRELRRYPNAEFMWAQEEPMNMGGYAHICPRLETCMRNEDREVSLPRIFPVANSAKVALQTLKAFTQTEIPCA